MRSERSLILEFLQSIDTGDFIALAPSRERFDQSEGHHEARQVAAERGITNPSWVFWHDQSDWVFDTNGNLVSGLLLHWGGDHDWVLAALSKISAPLRVLDHGQGGAIKIVSDAMEARLKADFPNVADTRAVKARINAITGPVERRKPETWTPEELAWFEDVLVQGDLAAQGAVVGWLTKSPELSEVSVDHLVANWTSIYPKAPDWVLVADFLRQLDRRGDPRLEALLDIAENRKGYVFRAGASQFLTDRLQADPHGAMADSDLERLARFAHDPGRYTHTPGNGMALRGLIEVMALRGNQSKAEVAASLLTDRTFDVSALNELNKWAESAPAGGQ